VMRHANTLRNDNPQLEGVGEDIVAREGESRDHKVAVALQDGWAIIEQRQPCAFCEMKVRTPARENYNTAY
jgi:hypothetical protein